MAKGRKHVNLAKFVRLWNENASEKAIMSAMGWEPAGDSDPFKRIRAQASLIRTSMGGKVKDEETGHYLKLKARERKARSINGKAKVAKVAKANGKVDGKVKAAKANVTKGKVGRPKGHKDGRSVVTVDAIGILRSKDGTMAAFKIPELPRVVFPWPKALELQSLIEELKAQPIDVEVEAAEAAEATEAEPETKPEAPAETAETAETVAPETAPQTPTAESGQGNEQHAA